MILLILQLYLKKIPMRHLKKIAAIILILVVSINGVLAQQTDGTDKIKTKNSVVVVVNQGNLTIENKQGYEYHLRVYSSNGMLEVYKNIREKEYIFNANELDSERFYYSIKIENTHIKKGVINTIPNNHLTGS